MTGAGSVAGTAVALEGLWKYFGDYPALRDISLQIEPGTCMSLLGRNGAGKTTLLRILAGLSTPAKGQVSIFGLSPKDEGARRRVGVLGHAIGLYDELSAMENLRLFGRLYEVPNLDQTAREWLERVGLERVATGLVREFSRGMRQRLAVARSFLHDPDVLLLDEPFTALDDRAVEVLQRVLRGALADGKTVIMSTHQLREALELSSHVCLISRGKVAFTGVRTAEMLSDPGWLYRNFGEA